MSLVHGEEDRQVIPRWRDSATTHKVGELNSVDQFERSIAVSEDVWKKRLQEWHDNPVASFASDLLGSAIAIGRSVEALEAAAFLVKSGSVCPQTAKEVAQRTIIAAAASGESEFDLKRLDHEDLYPEIRRLRHCLQEEPRDSFGWCDLALIHETLGQVGQAERAMRVALSLAPDNRMILRAAARLFLHHGDLDRAHDILAASRAVKHDTWVLAAEIAVATACRRTSMNLKRGKKILKNQDVAPRHLSELESAIATVDLHAGNLKYARRSFRRSLMDPTENALAQAKWAARCVGAIDVESKLIENTPLSHEAAAWELYMNSEWASSLQQSWRWFRDQPFSSLPAIHGSFIATTVLEEHKEAVTLARCGLVANPDSFTLRNNLCVALARSGQVAAAREEFSRVRESQLEDNDLVTWLATAGLIEIRRGDIESGRASYARALEHATAARDERLRVMALLNMTMELMSAGVDPSDDDRSQLLTAAKKIKDPAIGPLVARIRCDLSCPDAS